jgi:hypothetical protein
MRPKKSIVILTTISVVLLFFGLFFPWMAGEPTGNRTMTQEGNITHVAVEFENISGWQVIFAGLTPACVVNTLGPNWTLLPLIRPLVAILALVFVLLPWRKRPAIKRDGFLLLGMAILPIISLWSWTPTCPAEITHVWRFAGNTDTIWTMLFGVLFMLISGGMIVFAKPTKPVAENVVIEYRTCLKCKESVDKTISVCPHCGNPMN